MIRRFIPAAPAWSPLAVVTLVLVTLVLVSCDNAPASRGPAANAPDAVTPSGAAPAPAGAKMPATPSSSRNPDEVLAAWGKAIEARDWLAVRLYWGDNGAMSGMDEARFVARWSGFKAPQVTLAPGSLEGAAGSLYYTAPVTITDGTRVVKGEVTMRRANDIPGATADQLRWHIHGTTLPL